VITVACVYVKGPYPYSVDYVVRLERMVRRYLQRPFTFVCLGDADTTREIVHASVTEPGFSPYVIQIKSLAGVVPDNGSGYWNKLRLFDPLLELRGRVLFLDLDTLIVAPLDPIVDYPAGLALTTDALVTERAHIDRDRYGRRLVRRFNSSVMVFDGGTHADLWTRWSPKVAEQLSTDQDWIGEQAEDAVGMPLEWFPRISRVQPPWPEEAKVVLVKKPKNHEAVTRWPWFEAQWGGWAA
jgi:hypothetical protein